jgi:hypothetical protein
MRYGRIRRLECGVDGRKWRKLEDALLPPSSILRQALALHYPCLSNSFIPALGLFLRYDPRSRSGARAQRSIEPLHVLSPRGDN